MKYVFILYIEYILYIYIYLSLCCVFYYSLRYSINFIYILFFTLSGFIHFSLARIFSFVSSYCFNYLVFSDVYIFFIYLFFVAVLLLFCLLFSTSFKSCRYLLNCFLIFVLFSTICNSMLLLIYLCNYFSFQLFVFLFYCYKTISYYLVFSRK